MGGWALFHKMILAVALAGGLCLGGAAAAEQYKRVETIFEGGTTVMGEAVHYPKGAAQVDAVIVTLLPGEETGWHTHGEPMFAYVLEGEVKVDYGAGGTRTYTQGMGFLEAMAVAHDGRNTGETPCRILAVFLGAEGLRPTSPAAPPH